MKSYVTTISIYFIDSHPLEQEQRRLAPLTVTISKQMHNTIYCLNKGSKADHDDS